SVDPGAGGSSRYPAREACVAGIYLDSTARTLDLVGALRARTGLLEGKRHRPGASNLHQGRRGISFQQPCSGRDAAYRPNLRRTEPVRLGAGTIRTTGRTLFVQ